MAVILRPSFGRRTSRDLWALIAAGRALWPGTVQFCRFDGKRQITVPDLPH